MPHFRFPRHFLACLILLAGLSTFAVPPLPPPLITWRTLEVLLLKPDGKPAPDVDVQLFGLERDAMGNIATYRSDAEGRFTVKFGKLPAPELRDLTGQSVPGWGAFHLFAETPHDGRALSPQLINARSNEQPDRYSLDTRKMEIFQLASGISNKLTLRLRPGITLSGRVLSTKGRPLGGANVGTYTDLHVSSHTGYGGEIFENHTTTDADGHFTLSGIYPGKFNLGVSTGETPVYWIRTKIRSKWAEEMVDEIAPKRGEREIAVRIILSSKKLYRYFGRVTDSAGKPVAGATITAGLSRHRAVTTWGDCHHYEDTATGADGRYELMTSTPFARGFSVRAPGFKLAEKWADDYDDNYAPGKYNYRLQPSAAKE